MPPVYKYIVVWKDLEEDKIYRTKISFEREFIELLFNSFMSDRIILYLFKMNYNGALSDS